jgi:hypothetical protein
LPHRRRSRSTQIRAHCYESLKHLSDSDVIALFQQLRGVESERSFLHYLEAVSAAATVTYGALGMLFCESLIYMLATLARLEVGSEAVIPILGYQLFNFWLPMPLAVVFYPTLG